MKVYTITLWPYLESLLVSDGLISGRVNRVQCTHSRAMGSGVIVGRMLRRLRIDTFALGLLGRENAGEYLHLLGDKAGECEFLSIDGRTAERILLRAGGSRLWLERPGAEVNEKDLNALARTLLHRLEPGDFVVLCGFTPMMQDEEETDRTLLQESLARFCRRVRAVGGRVAVDGIFSSLGCLHYARPEIALLPAEQLKNLTGITPSSPLRLRAAMAMAAGHTVDRILVPCGGSTVTCLSKGHMMRGCISYFGADSAPAGHFDNSTLKGERILAGYVAALASGVEGEECLKLSCGCALPEFGRSGCWGKREILRTCSRALVREWNVS